VESGDCRDHQFHRGAALLSTADLFVRCYTLAGALILSGQVVIPVRLGPVPGCSDTENSTIALVRDLLRRRSESGFLTEIRRDHGGLFPRLPHNSEFNQGARWLWRAFEQVRVAVADLIPADN
jgi:hypothetical protein